MDKVLRIVLEKVDDVRITRASKRKAEAIASATDEGSEQSEPVSKQPANSDIDIDIKPILVTEQKPVSQQNNAPAEELIRNTNSQYTVKSNKCLLCTKSTPYLSTHYANYHEGCEVYSARMSEKQSDKLRRTPPEAATRINRGKLQAFCYYCENTVKLIRSKWIDHLIRHTGEYTRFCTKCQCTVTSTSDKSKCSHTDPNYRPMVEFQSTLFVYMCNYCNYTQSQEVNMKKHIQIMHDIQLNISSQYKKITLIPNFARVRETQRAISTDGSESAASVMSTNDDVKCTETKPINTEVFQPTNQLDTIETNDPTFKLFSENTYNDSPDTSTPKKRPSVGESIIDRLQARFKNESSKSIKKETDEREDQASIVFRSPDEMANARANASSNSNGSAGKSNENTLKHGTVIENEYKIEVNKTEVNTTIGSNESAAAAAAASTPATAGADNDDSDVEVDVDDDGDQSWESVSSDSEDDKAVPKKDLSRLILSNRAQKANSKTARTRQQQHKKRGFTSLACKLEKSDDASNSTNDSNIETTNPIVEMPKEKSPVKPVILGEMSRVDNMGWTEDQGSEKYHCLIGDCCYISCNNSNSLSNHLRKKHSNVPWTGYCYICQKHTLDTTSKSNLMKEFSHMLSHKPEKVLMPTPSTSSAASGLKTAAQILAESVGTAESPVLASIPPSRQPQIRIRSDLFGQPPAVSASAPEQPVRALTPIVIANVSSIQSPNLLHLDADALTAPFVAPINANNPLKPWTLCENTKSSHAEAKLKRECSLVALFKCMATDCIFTTSDKDKMLTHLTLHEDYASDSSNTPIEDFDSWLECCYCEEIPGSCTSLVQHIIEEHSTSIFQVSIYKKHFSENLAYLST